MKDGYYTPVCPGRQANYLQLGDAQYPRFLPANLLVNLIEPEKNGGLTS